MSQQQPLSHSIWFYPCAILAFNVALPSVLFNVSSFSFVTCLSLLIMIGALPVAEHVYTQAMRAYHKNDRVMTIISVLRNKPQYFAEVDVTVLMWQVTQGVAARRDLFCLLLEYGFVTFMMLILQIGFGFVISPELGGFLLVMFVAHISLMCILGQFASISNNQQHKVPDFLAAWRTVKSLNAFESVGQRLSQHMKHNAGENLEHKLFLNLAGHIPFALIFAGAMWLWPRERGLHSGYFLFMVLLILLLKKLGELPDKLRRLKACWQSIIALQTMQNVEKERTEGMSIERIKSIECVRLLSHELFGRLTLCIQPNEKILLVLDKPRAAKKLFDVLSGLDNVYCGDVKFNGTSIKSYAPESIRQQIRYFSPDAPWLDIGLENNLLLGCGAHLNDVSPTLAKLDLPYPLPTNTKLSARVLYKLKLARVLLQPCSVALYDFTDIVMSENERGKILDTILLPHQTCIVAMPNAKWRSRFDRMLVLSNGQWQEVILQKQKTEEMQPSLRT